MSAAIDWPSDWLVSAMTWRLQPMTRVTTSPYSGAQQVVDLIGDRWAVDVRLSPMTLAEAAEREATLGRLRGMLGTVTLWHLLRPEPRGTMRGTPVLASAAARGAQTLAITTTASATLLAGDMIGIGGELLMVAAPATAGGTGAMTVTLTGRLRGAHAAAAAIVWDRPRATFRVQAQAGIGTSYGPAIGEAVDLELLETWT